MKRAVDHVEPAAQAQLQLGAELGVVLLGEQEDAHEAQRLVAEGAWRRRLDLAVLEDEAVDFLAMRGVEREEGPFRLRLAAAAKPVADACCRDCRAARCARSSRA